MAQQPDCAAVKDVFGTSWVPTGVEGSVVKPVSDIIVSLLKHESAPLTDPPIIPRHPAPVQWTALEATACRAVCALYYSQKYKDAVQRPGKSFGHSSVGLPGIGSEVYHPNVLIHLEQRQMPQAEAASIHMLSAANQCHMASDHVLLSSKCYLCSCSITVYTMPAAHAVWCAGPHKLSVTERQRLSNHLEVIAERLVLGHLWNMELDVSRILKYELS